MMLRRGRGKPRPFKRRMVAVIDHWENDAVVGTYVTAPGLPGNAHDAAGRLRDLVEGEVIEPFGIARQRLRRSRRQKDEAEA
jgi:hypothetical protein